jgi:hypothetical protein
MPSADLIAQSRTLRAAVRACRDRSAVLILKSAATIFRTRLIVEKVRERLESLRASPK